MFTPSVSTEQVEDLFYLSATTSSSDVGKLLPKGWTPTISLQINQMTMMTVMMMKTMKMKGRVYESHLLPVP